MQTHQLLLLSVISAVLATNRLHYEAFEASRVQHQNDVPQPVSVFNKRGILPPQYYSSESDGVSADANGDDDSMTWDPEHYPPQVYPQAEEPLPTLSSTSGSSTRPRATRRPQYPPADVRKRGIRGRDAAPQAQMAEDTEQLSVGQMRPPIKKPFPQPTTAASSRSSPIPTISQLDIRQVWENGAKSATAVVPVTWPDQGAGRKTATPATTSTVPSISYVKSFQTAGVNAAADRGRFLALAGAVGAAAAYALG